jgi:hypothetical protein
MAISKITSEADGKADAYHSASGPPYESAGGLITATGYTIALCLPAIFSVAVFFYWVAVRVAYPYELDYGEGIVLWQAKHVIHLAAAYAPFTQYPYIVFHYTPLYHLVSFATSKLTGDLLLAGRLVSSLSGVGICLTLAWLVYRSVPAWAPRVGAIGGAVLAVTLPCGLDSMRWTPLMRVDMLGLWFTFAGLGVFVLARTVTQRYVAFIFFVAAMYTRQTLIAGAVACLLVAAVMNLRQAIRMLALTSALGGVILAALSFVTHGQIIKHLFVYNLNRFSIIWSIGAINTSLVSTLPLMALAVGAAFGPIRDTASAFSRRTLVPLRTRLSASTYRFALFTFTVHFILSGLGSLASGKSGANINYFLEWNLSACALASLFVARLLWDWRPGRLSSAGALAYLLPILIIAQQSLSASRLILHRRADRAILVQQAQDSEALELILRNSPEPVMSEDMTLLYKTGQQVPFEPSIVTETAATGVWDETPLINLITNRAFSVMVVRELNSPRYSPAVLRAIVSNYRPKESRGSFTVYVPR